MFNLLKVPGRRGGIFGVLVTGAMFFWFGLFSLAAGFIGQAIVVFLVPLLVVILVVAKLIGKLKAK